MNLVNLANGLTVWLSEVRHQFWPQQRLVMVFTLCPTVGVPYAQTLDLLRSWQIQWDEEKDPAVMTTFLGASGSVIKTALLEQYAKFSRSEDYHQNLRGLFEYIEATGISP